MERTHPIVIANPKPFRLILRDNQDEWVCTTEQINNSTYDYVRLHRLTRFIDVDLYRPFTLGLGYDGSLILPFIEQYADVNLALDEFNRIIACCFVGGLYLEAVSPSDLSLGQIANCGYFRHERPFGESGELHRAFGEKAAGDLLNIRLYDPPQITSAEFEEAYSAGKDVLALAPTMSPTLLVTAFSYYLTAQHREALTHAWISVEQLVEVLWREKVVSVAKGGDIPKRRKFLESQQWSLAHRVELLFSLGVIGEDLYKHLNVARPERNDFQHNGAPPSKNAVKSALLGIADLLGLIAFSNGQSYDKTLITRYLSQSGLPRTPAIAPVRAEQVRRNTASHWRRIKPVPGFSEWDGDFETFEDIQLQRIDTGA